jgi:glycosyltransferase involved in cell wall biosynthesis
MRIAIIAEVFLPKIDGVVHRTMNLIRQLVQQGDDVLVVCPQAEGCHAAPVPTVAIRSFSFPLYPEYQVGLPDGRLTRAIERFNPDLIHYVNPFAFGFRCCDVLAGSGVMVPSVFSFHTLYGEYVKQYRFLQPLSQLLWWVTREYHNRADINITVSSAMQADLIQRGFRRVRCWPPAVDPEAFHPRFKDAQMRARLLNGHQHKRLLLTVSRLAPEKNIGFLGEVLDRVPEACLAIVGDGPQRDALQQRFAGKAVNFVGYLKGRDLAAAYASADAFLFGSETETMGNVILESMACGCPVVAPRAGGIPSLVDHGRTGMMYAPGNLEESVEFTRTTLQDERLRAELGSAARRAVEDWSWSNSIERVRRIYLETVEQFRPTAVRATWRHRVASSVVSGLVSGFRCMASRSSRQARSHPIVHAATLRRASV